MRLSYDAVRAVLDSNGHQLVCIEGMNDERGYLRGTLRLTYEGNSVLLGVGELMLTSMEDGDVRRVLAAACSLRLQDIEQRLAAKYAEQVSHALGD